MPHPHLFEISAWPWLERLSARENRRISLANVPPADWDRIAARGFTHVFLMGVWQRSTLGRELALSDLSLRAEYDAALPGWTAADVCGSPYCVMAYEPDPRMDGWHGVDAARAEVNARGMKLLLDFVPNHTAFDHPWTSAHPERYVQGTDEDARRAPDDFRRVGSSVIACARDPYFPPWRDVAQLNHFNPDTREALARELRTIAAHCDGVRCDMAMLVLNEVFERTWRPLLRERWPAPRDEFWPRVTRAVPELLFLAEVYWDLEWTLQQQGFHYTYDKRLLDRLRGSSPADVRGHLRAEPDYSVKLARFLENHDEPRSAAVFGARLPAAAALLATLPGMRFYFDGQIEGRRIRTPVQLSRWSEEPVDPAVQAVYERLLQAAAAPLFHEGEWRMYEAASAGDGTFEQIVACRWKHGGDLAIVAVNLGSDAAAAYLPVIADVPNSETVTATDCLTGSRYRWPRRSLDARGLYVRLDPGEAQLFVVKGTLNFLRKRTVSDNAKS